jgi:geranylgeranylglycerol-phosphate geranylgeranyltransferase
MGHALINSLLKLSRASTSALAFALIFLPSYFHTRELWPSVALAIPIFPIAMCMFILNDINDIERDRINHPNRPLPAGSITIETAALVYLVLFGVSLALVRALIETGAHYLYLLGFLLAINYNTIVNHLPKLKTPYVAFTATIPVFIVNTAAAATVVPISIAGAIFLFVLGREILMDLQDSPGDGSTLAKSFSNRTVSIVALALQAAAMLALGLHLTNPLRLISFVMILLIFAFVLVRWKVVGSRQFLINLMKLELVAALVFLF